MISEEVSNSEMMSFSPQQVRRRRKCAQTPREGEGAPACGGDGPPGAEQGGDTARLIDYSVSLN